MKKLFALIAVIGLTLSLAACGGEAKLPENGEITMENIDEYLGRDDVQYIDLRNWEDKVAGGYISGFEMIPFFHYLNVQDIISGKGDTTAEGANAARLDVLFDKDAEAIFLMCQSGGRAGWVKAILDARGYENVYNVGGFGDYDGENKVAGDASYNLDPLVGGDLTPGTYVASAPADDHGNVYFVVLTVNANGGIENVFVDAAVPNATEGSTKQLQGDAYGMVDESNNPDGKLEWYMQANLIGEAIVAAQGWETAWDTDGIADVSVGIEEIKVAFDAAVALAD